MTTPRLAPLIGAAIFLLCYLAVSPIAGAFSVGELPLPGSPAQQVHEYLAANSTSSLLTGILQGLSGLGLAIVVASVLRIDVGPNDSRSWARTTGQVTGWVAVAAILASAILAIVLSAIAPSAGTDLVATVRSISFYAGGVVHVVALGGFVLTGVAVRGPSRLVRVIGWITGTVAVLSLLSTVVYYASLFLPLGRVTCMVALVVAGISMARRRGVAAAHIDSPQTA